MDTEVREPPLRIIYQLNSIALGGMENHALLLVQEMKRRGHQVTVILPEREILDQVADSMREMDAQVFCLDLGGAQPPARLLKKLLRMYFLVREQDPHVFHQHRTGPYHGKWASLVARLAGVPRLIVSEHQPAYPLTGASRWISRAVDRLVARFVTVSDYDRQQQLAHSDRPADKVVTVYNGLELSSFSRPEPEAVAEGRKALGLPVKGPVIGAVARLEEQKGITYLLRAAHYLGQQWPDLHLLIVGDGSLRPALEAEARSLGIADRTHFLGYQEDGARYIQLMDLFVLSSVWESFGITLLEAMASYRPVIASRVGGVPEVLGDNEGWNLVPPEDPVALAKAVEHYLADPELREQTGFAGRERVERLFSLQAMGDQMLALYMGNDHKLGKTVSVPTGRMIAER